jgi:gas vesicle protein
MSNENDNSKKLVLGLVLGAVIGASTLYFIKASRSQKTPILHKIGKIICEVGEELESSKIDSFSDIAQEIQKALPKNGDVLSGVLNWISTGVSLFQKFKK